ncbi:transcriptional regulator [Natranaerobius trueperi]|uniref:Transcriptional regulator n=1 Tax=Natranaerobius trueperi TaxID=759412 RepID=A0A226BW82_9FIRM|nr:transcriptional regulator [Natranaerobius trueperi]
MEFLRIGHKVINPNKIDNIIREILNLRAQGYNQSEVSKKLNIDRAFISKVESIGEVRKGGKVAVIGFPVANKSELKKLCNKYGVEYSFLMTDKERWEWLKSKSGEVLINRIMEIVNEVRSYDIIVVLGSNYRINLIKALLNKEVVGVKIGDSPIEEDIYVNPKRLESVMKNLVEG